MLQMRPPSEFAVLQSALDLPRKVERAGMACADMLRFSLAALFEDIARARRGADRHRLEARLASFVTLNAPAIEFYLLDAAARERVFDERAKWPRNLEDYVNKFVVPEYEDEEFAAALQECRSMVRHGSELHTSLRNCRHCYGELVLAVVKDEIRAKRIRLVITSEMIAALRSNGKLKEVRRETGKQLWLPFRPPVRE